MTDLKDKTVDKLRQMIEDPVYRSEGSRAFDEMKRRLEEAQQKIVAQQERIIDVVFDGPPSHESGRFVEVEDENQCVRCITQFIKVCT